VRKVVTSPIADGGFPIGFVRYELVGNRLPAIGHSRAYRLPPGRTDLNQSSIDDFALNKFAIIRFFARIHGLQKFPPTLVINISFRELLRSLRTTSRLIGLIES
jgi:hypothetical protein